jgi:hypothetical protein
LHFIGIFSRSSVHSAFEIEVEGVITVFLLTRLEGLVRLKVVSCIVRSLTEREVLREQDPSLKNDSAVVTSFPMVR